MKEQNFKNHARMVPMFHYVAFLLLLVAIAMCIARICCCCCGESCSADLCGNILLLILTLLIGIVAYYSRAFALRAQDRTIRLEENLRHQQMTGKNLPSNLKMSQIVALRFASDDEWLALMDRAIKEDLSQKEIKQSIKNWRGDYYRV